MGIETPDEESLAECSKRQNLRPRSGGGRQNAPAGRPLQVQGGFIVGFDSDTPSIFQRQIEFIQQSGIVTAMVGLLQAPTGTALYRRLKDEGRMLGEMIGNNVDIMTNIVPKMGIDALKAGYRQIMGTIYAPAEFAARVKTFLREYKAPKVRSPITWPEIRAFFASIWVLGIKSADRRYFWDLVGWTLRKRPELLPLAITMAVYGYHFQRITEANILS